VADAVVHGDIEFSTFVISLASNAAMQLEAGHPAFDLALARQTIDILAMLEVKTAGNLTAEERDLLRGLLYQIRLAWNEAVRAAS
jgi:hypothetical protein